ncbi:MAG: hypothetical protein KDA50_04700 [Rhodobacteraceae bacterium]|nr:hypothetical protein [Paracoccaceae bacterium]
MSFEDPALRRQATAVATLDSLPPDQTLLVLILRQWAATTDDQRVLWSCLSRQMGPDAAGHLRRVLDQLLLLLSDQGRRRLVRHDVECPCVGADEAVFANFVSTAAQGAREDALLMAMLLVRADMAPLAASLAQTVGLQLLRIARAPMSEEDLGATRH